MDKHKLIILILLAYTSAILISAKEPEETIACELEMAEIGKSSDVVVKLWSFSKSRNISEETIVKNAILGICFKGVNPNEQRRMRGIQPLIRGDYEQYKDYFNSFFNDPNYVQYVKIGLDGYAEQGDVIKLKKRYKVGRLVVIHLSELRKRLENDQVIKGLSYGF